ncbi:MAG TPA: alkaline phosphatase family protein [Pseudonocardiaceae bacterium]|nr:alkaline phosphatase family protein [Pseudonocardiaceae bacterium]
MELNRRQFIAGATAAGVLGLDAACAGRVPAAPSPPSPASSASLTPPGALPPPERSGIDHIVVVMMENRSFDHYLGWLPGADGKQDGLHYIDHDGQRHATHHLDTFTGCGHPDPDHSYQGGRVQFNGGTCDGFLRSGRNDDYAIGYYTDADLAFFGSAARDWTTCDRYFAALMGPTFPNRLFQHAAQTDRISNIMKETTLPTIWDRLAGRGIAARYYASDTPFLALWGAKYREITHSFAQFLLDVNAATMPAVSFVEPRFIGGGTAGTSGDDHPLADIRVGQHFLNTVYDAVSSGPNWERTVLIINYDEWGGFFDHVAPATAPDPRPDLGTGLRGFRVPCLVISPRAHRRSVAHGTYDHTSVLKMIEWRFGLEPLTVRDAGASNLAEVLDFGTRPDLSAPRYDVPDIQTSGCRFTAHAINDIHAGHDWPPIQDAAIRHGYAQPPAAPDMSPYRG